jgi:biopolymer transport protein ExbD
MALKTLETKTSPLGGSPEDEIETIVTEINITPLVDIFLVLLIIFMVTSSVLSQLGVDVSLPSASSAASAQESQESVIVTLGASGNGGLRVNGEGVPDAGPSLEAAIRRAFTQTKARTVILEGDSRAFLGLAVEVMDVAKKAGAERFSIATQAEKKTR